jgi:alpha-L-fucosidase 2
MLLQSHEKKGIRLLPALPKAWASGSVNGLTARGNIIVDMEWGKGMLKKVTLNSRVTQKVLLMYQNQEIEVEVEKGVPLIYNF